MNTHLFKDYINTPIGKMEIRANQRALVSIHFVDNVGGRNPSSLTSRAKNQLEQYFAGTLKEFDLPTQAAGTEFQTRVWQALTSIKYGETASYADIADRISNPRAVRAVGTANGKNPMTIVVPCHRIIGRDGSLTGYASGLERKAWLLNHELENMP